MNRHENIKNINLYVRYKLNEIYNAYNFDLFLVKKHVKNTVIKEAGKQIVYNSLTGINKLEFLLKNILKQLESAYKSLTTDEKQRISFKDHIVNAVENLLSLKDKNFYASQNMNAATNLEEATDVEIVFDDSKFEDGVLKKDKDKAKQKSDKDVEKEVFTIPGMDETGRDEAFFVFNKIRNQIEDTYDTLRNKLDRTVFSKWLPKNLISYMEAWDEEMKKVLNKSDKKQDKEELKL